MALDTAFVFHDLHRVTQNHPFQVWQARVDIPRPFDYVSGGLDFDFEDHPDFPPGFELVNVLISYIWTYPETGDNPAIDPYPAYGDNTKGDERKIVLFDRDDGLETAAATFSAAATEGPFSFYALFVLGLKTASTEA